MELDVDRTDLLRTRYLDRFPGYEEDGVTWARIPVRGPGDVIGSTVRRVADDARVLGYFPKAGEPAHEASCSSELAGRGDPTQAGHTRLGDDLLYPTVVGDTHRGDTTTTTGVPPGPRPEFLVAPMRIPIRRTGWGRDGFTTAVVASSNRFIPWPDGCLTVRHSAGAGSTDAVFRNVLDGRIDPRTGDICTSADS